MIFKKINWNTVYKKQSSELLGLCMRYVKDQKLAEDLLHDAFLTAIDKIETFKNIGSFNGWLKKIVLNTILQHLRQSNKLVISKDYDDNILQKVDQTESVVDKKYIIAQADFSNEEIVETLETLPEHHRIVFNLYVFEGYKHTQISKMLEISVGTSKSSLSRARKKLIELLYAKAEGRVKEEKKKRKVLAVLWILPLGDSFIDKVYRKGLNSFKIIPEKSLNISGIKETALVSSGMLIHLVPVLVLASVIGWVVQTTSAKEKMEKEEGIIYNSSQILNCSDLLSELKREAEKEVAYNESKLVVDCNPVQKKDTIKIQTIAELSEKYEIIQEDIVVVEMREDSSIRDNEKNHKYNRSPFIGKKETVFSYYILLDDFDSTIIGREKIELSKTKKNIKNPLLQICDDSTFCISYNQELDTISVLDPNTNTLILQVVLKSDRFCGKGWINSNRGYVNFIVQDSLRLLYRVYFKEERKVLFVKEEVNYLKKRDIDNLIQEQKSNNQVISGVYVEGTSKDKIIAPSKFSKKDTLIANEKENMTCQYCDTIFTRIGIAKTSNDKTGSRTVKSIMNIRCLNEQDKAHLRKRGKTSNLYYYSKDIEDSAIIGKEWIEFSTKKNKIDDSVLRFYEDSTFSFMHNHRIDTTSVMDTKTNTLIPQIIVRSEEFYGKGWLSSNAPFANFIVQDSLQLQYGLCMTDDNKVVFVKREVANINHNK